MSDTEAPLASAPVRCRRSPLCITLLLFLAAVALLAGAEAFKPSSAVEQMTRVSRRVRELEMSRAERRWEEIGWAHDLDTAVLTAHRMHRPLFVFTVKGDLEGAC